MAMNTSSKFRVEVLNWKAMSIVALYGELDVSVQELVASEVDRVTARGPEVLAIDLRGLSFMDSTGVHALISTGRRCRDDGRRFFVIRGGSQIDRALTACGVEGCFEMVSRPGELPDGETVFGADF
jgi:anti-sigma B factor antagonist